jgi:hypothetical protein
MFHPQVAYSYERRGIGSHLVKVGISLKDLQDLIFKVSFNDEYEPVTAQVSRNPKLGMKLL